MLADVETMSSLLKPTSKGIGNPIYESMNLEIDVLGTYLDSLMNASTSEMVEPWKAL
jgi:hypothetical protein